VSGSISNGSKLYYGTNPTGNPIFDSQPMIYATTMIKRRDQIQNRAARVIQRRWRASYRQCPRGANRTKEKKVPPMKSRTVSAPAYFGESCLWVPLERWGTDKPASYTYTARCETRCEVVYVAREAVHDLVNQFSPWLGERLNCFRQAVQTAHKNQGFASTSEFASGIAGDSSPRSQDWAATDLGITDDGLGDMHCQTLLRTADTSALRYQTDNAQPRMPRAQTRTFTDVPAHPGRRQQGSLMRSPSGFSSSSFSKHNRR